MATKILVLDDGPVYDLLKSLNIEDICEIKTEGKELENILENLSKEYHEKAIIFINVHLKFKNHEKRSDCNGLEILKHIRLTKKLNSNDFRPALLPIIVGTSLPDEDYIRKSPDNIIIYSPLCKTIFLPDLTKNKFEKIVEELELEKSKLEELIKLKKNLKVIRVEEIRELIEDYILFTKKEYIHFDPTGIPTSHDIRNDIGPGILLKELGPTDTNIQNDQIIKNYKEKLNTIYGKKVDFLKHKFFGTIRTEPSENRNNQDYINDLQNFRNLVQDKKFILIDDEYHKGWAYALYFGLFGQEESSLFRREECQEINNKFLCFSSYEAAKNWFDRKCEEFKVHLIKWAEEDGKLYEEIKNKKDIEKIKNSIISNIRRFKSQLEEFFPYDLVFLDLRLEPEDKNRSPQKLSGMKLLKLIKEFNRGIPVIIFTASEKATVLETALKNGADGYWIKCVDDGVSLIQMIKNLCFWEIESGTLNRAEILKRLWIKIRMVEEKKWFWYWEHYPSFIEFIPLHLNRNNEDFNDFKNEILLLLKTAFETLNKSVVS